MNIYICTDSKWLNAPKKILRVKSDDASLKEVPKTDCAVVKAVTPVS